MTAARVLASLTTVAALIYGGATASARVASPRLESVPTTLPCKSPGRVLAVSATSVLTYNSRPSKGSNLFPGNYACSRGHKVRSVDDGADEDGFQLRGSVVSRYLNACATSTCDSKVEMTDLVTGKEVTFDASPGNFQTTVRVVPVARHVVFWTTQPADKVEGPQLYELRRGAADGSQTVIDNEPGIDPGSLAVAGTRLYWTVNGSPRIGDAR